MIKEERPELKKKIKALEIMIGGLFYLLLIIIAVYVPYKTMAMILGEKNPDAAIKVVFWVGGIILYGIIFGIGYAIYANRKDIITEFQSIGKRVLGQK